MPHKIRLIAEDDLRSADVPPAILLLPIEFKIAGEMPALRNH
jgi:hypothetical protein